ncbi:MAG TPA: DinB family protein [Candidatus Micrarchaeaceae archaeon]|nr:DinB family protein [Candidatus Micrarchaeaceae archaeon]
MTNESTTFTATDLQGFLDEMIDHDRLALADRLQRASDRLAEYGPLVSAAHGQKGGGSGAGSARPDALSGDVPPPAAWSAHEVLAHIVVLSKFYGVIFHKVSSGKMTELDLLNNVGLRDAMDEQMAQIEPKELIRMALEDHARTIQRLHDADAASMRRVVKVDGGETMTAEEVARLPLISHLELHIDQLLRALA